MSGGRRIEPQFDRSLLRRLTVRPSTAPARVVRALVPLADHLKPWLVVTPVLVARGATGRRAASSAWAAVVVATALAKATELAVRRARPATTALRDRVVAGDEPSSSSFPSTHTSSAVAFVGGTVASSPATGALLAPIMVLVAWSRLAGGRHYPTDVAGGALIGAAAAVVVSSAGRRRG
jgi:undecaprenyl-diphosphatase